MDFDWTADEKFFGKEVAAAFDADARAELAALEDPHLSPAKLKQRSAAFLKKLAGSGYLDAPDDPVRLLAGREELARLSGSLFLVAEGSARLYAGLVARHADPVTHAETLALVRAGDEVGAVVLPTATPGDVTAQRDADGFVLQGERAAVPGASVADRFAVVAATGKDEVVVALVSREAPGLTVGDRRATLGHAGRGVADLSFAAVRVPAKQVIGPKPAAELLDELAVELDTVLAIAAVGGMERGHAAALKHAKAAPPGGGKPLMRRQEVGFRLSEMHTQIQASRWLVRRAAWMAKAGDVEAATLARCAKVFCAECAEAVASTALQVLGADGYLRGNEGERAYREAKLFALAGTPTEQARIAIADDLLRRNPV